MSYMGKSFRADGLNQSLLLPPSLHDWLPERHLARFLVDVVAALDLSAIYASYAEKDGGGQAAYAPEMMLRVLLYGYATGSTVRARSNRAPLRTWLFVIFPQTNIPITTRLQPFASGTWRLWPRCLRRLCCCAKRRAL